MEYGMCVPYKLRASFHKCFINLKLNFQLADFISESKKIFIFTPGLQLGNLSYF